MKLDAPPTWSRRWAPSGRVLLAEPVGRRAFRFDDVHVVADADRVWELRDAEARAWPIASVEQAVPEGDDVRLETASWVFRLSPAGMSRTPWSEGILVGGLRITAVDGLIVVGDRALEVVERGERFTVGPRGQLAVVGPRGLRVAPPGRTPADVGIEVDPDSLAWIEDGRTILVTAERGRVGVHVATREVGPVIRTHRAPEASCALSGTLVAGPLARVWDLRDGSSLPRARVALGATVAAGPGFVTVDWETHRGWWIDPTRDKVGLRFRLPLDPDDTVVGGRPEADGVLFWSAEGRCFHVRGARVEEVETDEDPPEQATARVETPAGPFEAEGEIVFGGRRFVWSGTGGLLGWPDDR